MQNKPSYKELEERIAALEKRSHILQHSFSNCCDWRFLYNCTNRIEFVSKGFENIIGYKPEALISGEKTLKDIIHPNDYDVVIEKITPKKEGKNVSRLEFRAFTSTGEEQMLELESLLLPNTADELFSLVKIKPITNEQYINELQTAKKRLEESNKRFQAFSNSSFGGIAIHDNGKIVECNQSFCDMFKYTMEELIGMDGLLIISPEHRDLVMHNIKSGFNKPYEAIAQRKDGNRFPCRIHGKMIPYRGKQMRVTEFHDLTEQNSMKDNLAKVIDFNPLSIQIVDKDGYTIKTNPAHKSLFGATPPSDYSIFNDPQIDDQGLTELINEVKKGKTTFFPDFQYNAHYVNPDFPDKPIWIKMIVFPLTDSKNNTHQYVLMHEDITIRKNAEEKILQSETQLKQQNEEYLALNEELRQINEELLNSKEKIEENEQRLRAMSNNLPNGFVYQVDTGTNMETRKFTYISNGVEKLHEVTPEQVMENANLLYNQVIEEDRPLLIEAELTAKKNMSMFRIEVRFRLPSGKIEWRLLSSAPRKTYNGHIIWDGIEIDINEHKIGQQILEETKEKYRFMVENIKDILWRTDKNFVFTYVSPVDETIRGFKNEEVVGYPIWKFMNNETAAYVKDLKNKLNIAPDQSDELQRFEFEYACKDGSWIWIDVAITSLFDKNGNIAGYQGITRDISEQKAAEIKQKEIEDRLQLSLEVNNASFFQNNFETGEVISTPQLYHFMGYSTDEVPTKIEDLIPLVHQDDIPVTMKAIEDHFNGLTKNYYAQFRMRTKSGEWKWVEGHGKGISPDSTKKPTLLLGISRSIDEQKRAEDQLIKSRKQLESFIRNAPVVLFALDKKGIFTFSDGNGLKTLGFKPNQVVGTSALELYAEYPEIVEHIKNALNGKVQTAIHDMGNVVFDTHYSPIINAHGNIEGVIGVATDITERRRAESQILTLSRAIEQSPSTIIITDSEGKIEFINAKFINFMQYSLEEVKNKTPRIFNAGHIEHKIYSKMWETLRSGNIWQGEFLNRKKDGTQFWESVTISPILNSYKKISNYILIMEDITEKKQMLEELIVAKEKAEDSNRLKSAFLQNMSHEIRTPMNAIIGFSDMLGESNLSVEKRASFTKIIQNSSQQLLSIVSDILTISALETKQEKVELAPICINDIIVELLSIFKTQATNQNISIYTKQELSDSRSVIYTDKTKLVQILTNLLTNALKFTHNGNIEFGYQLISDEKNSQTLKFYVKDTGIGIAPEALERIFERFSQADTSINRKYGGTGLGLAISKAFVELMGGEIWVESKLEHGSTFYFTIPYKPDFIAYEPDPTQNNNTQAAIKTILVAEDEEYNYLLIEEILNRFNFNIIHAKNGEEVVELCSSNNRIDIVLMDIKMPIMDGLTATKIIKKMYPKLPIIALSAYALEHEIEKYNNYGFSGYITKPIDRHMLIEMISKLNNSSE